MRREWRATGAAFAAFYASYTQFRAEFLLFMMAGLLPIYMMFGWMSLAESGITADVDPTWFAAYFLVIYGTRQMCPIWVIRHFDQEVRMGELSHHLLRPTPVYWRLIASQLADNAVRLPIVLVFVPLGLWALDAFPYIAWERLPLYLLTLALGALLHFHLEMLIGLAAFWTNQSLALEETYNTAFYLLTGFTIPLAMFPDGLQQIVGWLPWWYIFGLPAEILIGQHTGADLAIRMATQFGWLIAVALAARFVWRRGLRRYTAAGS